MSKTYLGIDLGGTNVRVAKVTETGEILQVVKSPTYATSSSEFIVENIISQIKLIDNIDEVSGIGVGVPGPVDQVKGSMPMCSNIPPLKDIPLVSILQETFNKPVVMDNDANVAGLAEATVGSGKGKNIVVYITHSTGIGGGMIVNGQTISGRHGYAGEIANIIVDRDRPLINHLNAGAVENEASGTALIRKAQERIDKSIDNAKTVFELAAQKNQEAIKLVDEMCFDFALMCSTIAHVLDPDVYVIGGGVSKSHDAYLGKMIDYYKTMIHPGMRDVDFVLASLDEPGIIGAAMLPKSKGF